MEKLIKILSEKKAEKTPLMVALSGIDGSGKGCIGSRLHTALRKSGVNSYLIGIDGWLELPENRFNKLKPAEHFYNHGFRFDEMFTNLINPLRRAGSIDLFANHADPGNSNEYVPHHYQIKNAEVVFIEGIFLFQQQFDFDYRIWIECSFETAFRRSLLRNQEGLSPEELHHDYDTIYFAAQRLHFEKDNPQKMADYIFNNEDELENNK